MLDNRLSFEVIFFDLTDYSLLRFPLWISAELTKEVTDVTFTFVHLYEYNKKDFDLVKLPKNSRIHNLKGNIKAIDTILLMAKNAVLVSFALRPPEFYINKKAKQLGIKTFVVQHGIFIPFMKREPFFFIEEFKKLVLYLKCTYYLSQIGEVNIISILKEIFHIYIKGRKNISQSIFSHLECIHDLAFVYSDYWKSYFIDNYGFNKEQFVLVGTPDLADFDLVLKRPLENAICYICQTLVEDGRISKEVFINFIQLLTSLLTDDDIFYLKVHPRTDLDNYAALTSRKNTFIVKDYIPHCTKYAGHYSTLLSLCITVTKNVFFWEFEGHEIPEYFKKCSDFIGNTKEDLIRFTEYKNVDIPNIKNVEYYFNKPNMKPFKLVAKELNYDY